MTRKRACDLHILLPSAFCLLPDDPAGCLDLGALFGALEGHGYRGFFSIEMFSEELWTLPAKEAAHRLYQSLLPLCRE